MTARFDTATLAPAAYQALFAVTRTLEKGELPKLLKHLIDLRVSQVNGCSFCIALHREWGLRDGERQERLDTVAEWSGSDLFSPAEKAALAWAEALTQCRKQDLAALEQGLVEHFSPAGVAELTMAVATINAWNRVGIAGHIGPVA